MLGLFVLGTLRGLLWALERCFDTSRFILGALALGMVPGRVFAGLLVLVLPHGVSALWLVVGLLGSLVNPSAFVASCGADHIKLTGFDVVVTPAELQAEVPGRPPKTTGTQSKCEQRTRTRRLTELGDASLRTRPVVRVAASETGWRRRRAAVGKTWTSPPPRCHLEPPVSGGATHQGSVSPGSAGPTDRR
jgi:hypothetical protein